MDTIRVLHIEDTTSEARLIHQLLGRSKNPIFEIEWASELRKGLMLLAEKSYDLVISDLQLPDAYGLGTFRLVQDHALNVPIILLTNIEDDRLALQAIDAGAQDYVRKSQLDGDRLINVVRFAIGRHRLMSEMRDRYESTLAELERKLASRHH